MSPLAEKLSARIRSHGLSVSGAEEEKALAYLELLARWNRKINLTAFDLSAPKDEAIDRLVIEPFAASALVRPTDRVALDVGSGGGSPAVPLAIRCPGLRMTLVEARQRKTSFLRETIRVLDLSASVAPCRLEDVAQLGVRDCSVDLLTIRAVRLSDTLERAMVRLLNDAGLILMFGYTTENKIVSFRRVTDLSAGELSVGRRP